VDGTSPASLVKTDGFDTTRGKSGKEFIIAINVVTEPVDEDQFSLRDTIWLERALVEARQARGLTYLPGLCVERLVPDFVGPFDFCNHLVQTILNIFWDKIERRYVSPQLRLRGTTE
jgi:hypothetical protein